MADKKLDDFFDTDPVFKDTNVFQPEWKPDVFKYREAEYDSVATMFAAHYQGQSNVFITGPPGTAKTQIVQKLIESLNVYTPPAHFKKKNNLPVKFVMVNCRQSTFPKVCNDTLLSLGGTPVIGVHSCVICEKIARFVKNANICLIFDEADRMEPTRAHWTPIEDLAGTFSRFHEIYKTPTVSLVVISNNPRLCDGLDESTFSSYTPQRIKFKDYDVNQLYEILNERCNLGFKPDVISPDEVIGFSKIIRAGAYDLRHAFKALYSAGMESKAKKVYKITIKNLAHALKKIEQEMIAETLKDFDALSFALYYIITEIQLKKNQCAATAKKSTLVNHQEVQEIYKEDIWRNYQRLNKEHPLIFANHNQDYIFSVVVKKMEKQGFVKVITHGKGRGLGTKNTYEISSREDSKNRADLQELEVIHNVLKEEMLRRVELNND